MRKSATVLLFVLLFGSAVNIELTGLTKANFIMDLPRIIIDINGSVSPENEFIQQNGDLYRLAANISQEYCIVIKRSNIVFDGQGYCINGTMATNVTGYPNAGYTNIGLSIEQTSNVTVMNIEVSGFWNRDIAVQDSTNCSLINVKAHSLSLGYKQSGASNNNITESTIDDIEILYANNNLISKNNITSSIYMIESNSNIILENNILCPFTHCYFGSGNNFWNNDTVGNYWSDYSTRYPQASKLDNSGIWNLPYIINDNASDYHPLVDAVIIPLSQVTAQTAEPTKAQTLNTGSFPTIPVLAITATTAIVSVVLLVIHLKSKNKKPSS